MNVNSASIRTSDLPGRLSLLWAFMTALAVLTACSTPQEVKIPDGAASGSNAGCVAEIEPVDKLICEDRKLQELHAELQDIYRRLETIPQARVPVRESRKSWLRVRNGCLRAHCVEMVYRMRIDRMQMALHMCETDNRLMYASIAGHTERCQRSLLSLKVTENGEIMPMQGMESLVQVERIELPPARGAVAVAQAPRVQAPRFGRRINSRYVKEDGYKGGMPAESNRENAKAIKPGFDCSQELNDSERSICSDSYLSGLDNHLNLLYVKFREMTPSPGALKDDQLKWLRKRNLCREYECMVEVYNLRISEIILEIKKLDEGFSNPVSGTNYYD